MMPEGDLPPVELCAPGVVIEAATKLIAPGLLLPRLLNPPIPRMGPTCSCRISIAAAQIGRLPLVIEAIRKLSISGQSPTGALNPPTHP